MLLVTILRESNGVRTGSLIQAMPFGMRVPNTWEVLLVSPKKTTSSQTMGAQPRNPCTPKGREQGRHSSQGASRVFDFDFDFPVNLRGQPDIQLLEGKNKLHLGTRSKT